MVLLLCLAPLLASQIDSAPAERAELTLTAPVACRVVRGYDDFDPLERPELTRYEKLLVYMVPTGFAVAEQGGKYRAHLVQDVRLRRAGKKKVLWSRKQIIDFKVESNERPERLYLATTVGFKDFVPGDYELDLVVTDQLGEPIPAERTLAFKIIPPRPKRDADEGGGGDKEPGDPPPGR